MRLRLVVVVTAEGYYVSPVVWAPDTAGDDMVWVQPGRARAMYAGVF